MLVASSAPRPALPALVVPIASMPASSAASVAAAALSARHAGSVSHLSLAPLRSPGSSSSLESRLFATQQRITGLLDSMAWRPAEEDGQGARASVEEQREASSSSAAAPSAIAAPAASPQSADLLSSCRPLSRASFLAFVGTFNAMAWSHAELLSPLTCASYGWTADQGRRDTLTCRLCHSELHCFVSPSLSESAAQGVRNKYSSLLPTSHATTCPWTGTRFDEAFYTLAPWQLPEGKSVDEVDATALQSAEKKAALLAVHQALLRADSLVAAAANLGGDDFWSRLGLKDTFVAEARALLRTDHPSVPLPPTQVLLALCGWECRGGTAATKVDDLILQCSFGTRDVYGLDKFMLPATDDDGQAEAKEDTEDEQEAEERSALQSPIKKRRRVEDGSAAASLVSTAAPPRTSPTGFDPVHAHRPFCPLVLPRTTSNVALKTTASEPLLGWQQLLLWWAQRQAQPSTPLSSDDTASASTDPQTELRRKQTRYKNVALSVRQLLYGSGGP